MTDKERFDCFMKLSEFWSMRWSMRRKFEWSVSLGLWTVLIGATFYINKRPNDIALLAVLLSTLILYVYGWLRPLHIRCEQDAREYFYFKSKAESILDPTIQPQKLPALSLTHKCIGFAWGYVPLFQITATIAFLLCAYLFMGTLTVCKPA